MFPPHAEPLFPVTSYTPQSGCPHRKRIKNGSCFICMVCQEGSARMEDEIERSEAPPPNGPIHPGWWDKPEPTRYAPSSDGLKGGVS